jgi:hypothetical protein
VRRVVACQRGADLQPGGARHERRTRAPVALDDYAREAWRSALVDSDGEREPPRRSRGEARRGYARLGEREAFFLVAAQERAQVRLQHAGAQRAARARVHQRAEGFRGKGVVAGEADAPDLHERPGMDVNSRAGRAGARIHDGRVEAGSVVAPRLHLAHGHASRGAQAVERERRSLAPRLAFSIHHQTP